MTAVLTRDIPSMGGRRALPAGTRLRKVNDIHPGRSAFVEVTLEAEGWISYVPRDAIRWQPDATGDAP